MKLSLRSPSLAVLSLSVAALALACGSSTEPDSWEGDVEADDDAVSSPSSKTKRGYLYEYDPGPPADTRWASLFAETPNYRALGIGALGGKALKDERFRWEFGPMYYRGRLAPDSVKVFVVGQEGAQDESLSNRAFTGSTGTKMQNFLRAIGIDQSYLFMNTFVYTIHGQYSEAEGEEGSEEIFVDPKVQWIAQSPDSPIVQHRHKMFDYMYEINSSKLNLIIGVGRAGKESVASWVRHRWELEQPGLGAVKCADLYHCDTSVVGSRIKLLGLPHPGSASARNGGDTAKTGLELAFDNAVKLVGKWAKYNSGWLPPDSGISYSKRFTGYTYTNYPVPHRDFPFGSPDVLGAWGTTSNRRDDGKSIQMYSQEGCYNNYGRDATTGQCQDPARTPEAKPINLQYKAPKDQNTSIPELPAGDVPWESPRAAAGEFDRGPSNDLAKLLMGAQKGYFFPDWAALGATHHKSFGVHWYYRGRLDRAKVLVLADQASHDDLFSGRALTGIGGQRLQTFLKLANAGTDYAILRSLPVDTLDLDADTQTKIATDPAVLNVLGRIISIVREQSTTTTILTVGPMAKAQAVLLGLGGINVINMDAPDDALLHVPNWQSALQSLGSPNSKEYTGRNLATIPRADLPVHTKWWVGTAGSRALRAVHPDTGKPDPNYYKLYMPNWVANLQPPALTEQDRIALATVPTASSTPADAGAPADAGSTSRP